MNTHRLLQLGALSVAFMLCFQINAQNLGQRLKKTANKTMNKASETVADAIGQGDQNSEETVSGSESSGMISKKFNQNFIDRSNIVFHDDFNKEKAGEFPSKWTQISGTVENGRFNDGSADQGVLQMVSTKSVVKPTFDVDSYLGDSFKIELQSYFWHRGNEAYILEFYNASSSRPSYQLYLRGSNVAPHAGEVVYMPGKPQVGWSTAQISFNKGNLKVIVDGVQLINNPDINHREFDYLDLYTLSPGSNYEDGHMKARVNYITIAKEGLPLYDRIVSTGKIVVRDIYFDLNKYEIKPESYPALDRILKMLQEHEEMEVTIVGHTDSRGSNEDNLVLSEKRAEAVMNYYVDKGIKKYRMSYKGYGEEKPEVPVDNEEAWAQNRRVEFVLHK